MRIGSVALWREFVFSVLREFVLNTGSSPQVPPGLEWRLVGRWVSAKNLGPIFLKVLHSGPVPPPVFERWKEERHVTYVRNARAADAATRLFAIAEQAGTPMVAVRGLTLGHTIYGDPTLRPMTDVDILIAEADMTAIREAMSENGVEPSGRLRRQLVYELDGTIFELHWSLLTTNRYRCAGNTAGFLAARIPLGIPEGRIYRLPSGPELAAALAHSFLHHDLSDVRHILDIALLIRADDMDWDWLAGWCKANRFTRMATFALSMVNECFNLGRDAEIGLLSGGKCHHSGHTVEAYLARLLGDDRLCHHLRRQANMLRLTEGSTARGRQLIWLLSADQLGTTLALLLHGNGQPQPDR